MKCHVNPAEKRKNKAKAVSAKLLELYLKKKEKNGKNLKKWEEMKRYRKKQEGMGSISKVSKKYPRIH